MLQKNAVTYKAAAFFYIVDTCFHAESVGPPLAILCWLQLLPYRRLGLISLTFDQGLRVTDMAKFSLSCVMHA